MIDINDQYQKKRIELILSLWLNKLNVLDYIKHHSLLYNSIEMIMQLNISNVIKLINGYINIKIIYKD